MWVKFWHEGNCASGHTSREESYEWVSDDETDEGLKEIAEERVPSWRQWSERGFKYGFERVSVLPEEERLRQIRRHKRIIEHSARMLGVLKA